ncbi:MAG: hypothetical protein GX075_01110 [Firmicutes bacterium]|nr:hypothetical protein [Bacillota bacterium]
MLKLTGAILIIGTSSMIGFMLAERLKERCRLLRVLIRLLNILKTEINYRSGLLAEVFTRAARVVGDGKIGGYLRRIAVNSEYGSDYNFVELWDGFLHEKGMAPLSEEDIEILKELGNYLGCTGREDQLQKIAIAQARLESNLEAADLDQMRLVRLYRYFGFAAGAVLVCLLL